MLCCAGWLCCLDDCDDAGVFGASYLFDMLGANCCALCCHCYCPFSGHYFGWEYELQFAGDVGYDLVGGDVYYCAVVERGEEYSDLLGFVAPDG